MESDTQSGTHLVPTLGSSGSRKSFDKAEFMARQEVIRNRHADRGRRFMALDKGAKKYRSAVTCPRGHVKPFRYASDNACVQCQLDRSELAKSGITRYRASPHAVVKRPYTDAQQAALDAGRVPRYYGSPCRHGHDGLRYRGSKACVHCAIEHGKEANEKRSRGEPGYQRVWVRALTVDEWLRYSAAIFL